MPTDILFPLYELFVEQIFGSVGMAIMGVALALLLILFFTKAGKVFIIYWMIFYFMVMGTLYMGAFGLVFSFIIVTIYSLIAIIRFVFREV